MTESTTLVPPEGSDEFPSEEEDTNDVLWPHPELDKKRMAAILKNPHFMRKKRVHSSSFSHSTSSGLATGVPSDVHALSAALHRSRISGTRCLYGKNSRKPRDGRRVPNKRGGKSLEDPTDVLDEIVLDHDDPDYDSDSEGLITFESLSPAPSDEEFERIFTSIMNEFFDHGKTEEVLVALNGLNLAPHQRRRLPYLAVTMALQRKSTECELTSELLSDLCGKILTQAHVQQGFSMVLNELGELTIDFPKAPEHVGRFIARALIDDILPPKFIEFQKSVLTQSPTVLGQHDIKCGATASPLAPVSLASPCEEPLFESPPPGSVAEMSSRPRTTTRNLSDSANGTSANGSTVERNVSTSVSSGIGSASSLVTPGIASSQAALSALIKAESWLTLSHVFIRLDNIWGVPAGPRGTKQLSKKVHELIQNFFESNDLNEVTEALADLDSPHFLHELVFQAVVMAIEVGTDDAQTRVLRLLNELCRAVVITQTQLELGIRRIYSELPDLQLDVPTAYVRMERFLKLAHEAGFVSTELCAEMPAKPRKRFASETDSVYRRDRNVRPL